MKTHTRLFTLGAALLALAGWFLAPATTSKAADEKDPREDVLKLAGMIEKMDNQGAKQQAETIAKSVEEIGDVMRLMALRTKKGAGVGDKPGAIMPDGIEAKIMDLGKRAKPKKELEAQAKALEQAAYRAAAIAQIAQVKLPDKDKKDWQGWADDMYKGSLDLAKAVQAKDPKQVKAAATKLEGSCNSCHEKFR
jgi:hypothetical protein